MTDVDLNLLIALDVLLAEGSVTQAARRLGLSTSAMSRALTRLRAVTGDPLLVRAGRGLVPTPRAIELRNQVHELTRDARAILRPQTDEVDLATVEMTFTIRASESFMAWLSMPVVAAITPLAPRLCLRFEAKPDKDARPLREGMVDLEIGVIGTSAPEIRTRFLFHDAYVGIARKGHPILASAAVTLEQFAACTHVAAQQEGSAIGVLDDALEGQGLKRSIAVIVPGYPDAMRLARQSDLITIAPRSCLGNAMAGAGSTDLESFTLPTALPPFTVSALWHPRMDADPIHRTLRNAVIAVCQQAYPGCLHGLPDCDRHNPSLSRAAP